jgi:succinate-acetate transporter protein
MASELEHWTHVGPISTRASEEEIERVELRAAASVADPAPMGLLGFAIATFMWGTTMADWYHDANTALYLIPMILIFGGIGQFLASMWSYRKGDIFHATALGCFAAFNATFAAMLWLQHSNQLPAIFEGPRVTGIFMLCFAYIAFFLMFAAGKVNRVHVSTMLFLWISFLLMGLGNLLRVNILSILGGWAAIVTALIAAYVATALLINSLHERVVLSLGAAKKLDPPRPASPRSVS